MEITNEQLQQKINKARNMGIPDDVIRQKIGEDINTGKFTLPKSGSLPQSKAAPEKGWLGLEKKGFEGSFLGNLGQDVSTNVQGLMNLPSLAGKLISGELSLPETAGNVVKGALTDYGELAQQPLQTAYNKPITTALNVLPFVGPASKAISALKKLGGAGKAADIASDVGKLGKVTDVVSDVEKLGKETAEGLLESSKKVSPAARQYATIFTVPTKRAKSLKPFETSQKYVDYGITGKNLDELKDVNNTVNTVINATKKSMIDNSVGEVSLENVATTLKGSLAKSLSIPKEEVNRITGLIATKTPTGKTIFKVSPDQAFELQKQIEQMGHQYLSHNTYLTGNMHDLQLGQALLDAADEIGKNLDNFFKTEDISKFKNPEYLSYLESVSPKLAQDYLKAKTFKELRTLQSPFVKGEQMIDLTEQAGNSAASKVAKSFGEAGYQVAKPTVERVTGSIIPKIQTKIAGAMETPLGKAIGRLPKLGVSAIKSTPYGAMVGRNMESPQTTPLETGNLSVGDQINALMEQAPTETSKSGLGGLTKVDFDQMYEADLAATGGKNFAKIQLLEKRSLPAAKKAPPATVQKDIRLAQNANNTLTKLENIITDDSGQILASKIPGAFGARRYKALWGSLVDNIGYLRTGAAIDKNQRADYEWMLPQAGDTDEEVKQKIRDLRDEFRGIVEMQNQDWSGTQSLDTYGLNGLGE